MITEKIELLGKGLYKNIPDVLTLTSIPTASELDYVGSEDFEATMLDKIFPQAILDKGKDGSSINFRNLLEIDFHWVCRCLRILNYGPYYTTSTIYCKDCGRNSYGEYRVNLNTIECKPLPNSFTNSITILSDAFIDFDREIKLKLPTIQDIMNAYKDTAFMKPDGTINREFARICYMITSIGGRKDVTPIDVKLAIQKEFSPADYVVLKDEVARLTNYGLRAGGSAQCPKCGSPEGVFVALPDDRFFRPTVGDLREWKRSRGAGSQEDSTRSKAATV